jgi:hypothetical protein
MWSLAMTVNNLRVDINSPLDAHDALNHAHSMITFLQDVLTLHSGEHLPENITTTGLYFILQDIKDRILDANVAA